MNNKELNKTSVRIHQGRVALGVSVHDISCYLGVTYGYVISLENAYRNTNIYNMIRLSALYGYPIDYLLGLTDQCETDYNPFFYTVLNRTQEQFLIEVSSLVHEKALTNKDIDFIWNSIYRFFSAFCQRNMKKPNYLLYSGRIGQAFRIHRKALGLTQFQIAELLDMSELFYRYVEIQKRNMSLDRLKTTVRLLNVNLHDALFGDIKVDFNWNKLFSDSKAQHKANLIIKTGMLIASYDVSQHEFTFIKSLLNSFFDLKKSYGGV